MGGTAVVAGSMGLDALGQFFSGKSQSDANNANLAAQQQHQQVMQNYVNQYLQPGQNPYAQQMLNFIGQSIGNQGQQGQQIANQPQQAAPGQPGPGTGYNPGIPNNPGDPGGPLTGPPGTDPRIQPYMDFTQSMGLRMAPSNPTDGSGMTPSIPGAGGSPSVPMTPGYQPPGATQQQGAPGSGMYNYQSNGPYTYNPALLGNAPMIGGLPQVNAQGVFAPQAFASANYNPQQVYANQISAPNIGYSPGLQAQQIGGMPQLQAQQVGVGGQVNPQQVAATGTQGFNAGQDAIMQMMQRNLTPQNDPSLSLQLQQIGQGQGTLYNTSDLFKSIEQSGQQQLDQQVAKLQGSSGSLGQRFGSGTALAEGQLRQNYLTNTNALEQQVGMQAFGQQQAMRQPALNAQADLQNQNNQFGLQGFNAQAGLAQNLAGLGLQQGGQNLQASLANQQAGLQSGQFNINTALQAALANQQAGLQAGQGNLNAQLGVATANQGASLQAGMQNQSLLSQIAQANAGNQLQTGQLNQSAMLQAMLANQGAGMQSGLANQNLAAQLAQFNAGQGLQASQLNAQYGLQGQQSNQQAALQAAMANQNLLGQYGTSNANILNQAGQFNAQMGQNQNQFGAQQGNIYNNLVLQTLSQAAGLQSQQNAGNTSLLGILNGVGVPQQQASPWGSTLSNIGQLGMLLPFLNQAYGGSKPTGQITTGTTGGSGSYDPGVYGF